ncbi:hypothetical protein H0A71_15735 [Alcaligenaceae bacterium]|nr:hypothetical protein [Alcaligenaceae bacterium]
MTRTKAILDIANKPPHSNSLAWVFEKLEHEPSYIHTRMFGCEAAYVDGRLCLVIGDRNEPWNGLLVCTSHVDHAALIEEMPALHPHAVLGIWLYVSQNSEVFEETAEKATALVLAHDPRIGVEPKPRKRRMRR